MLRQEVDQIRTDMKYSKRNVILQDLQMIVFLFAILIGAVAIAASTREDRVENIIMYVALIAAISFAICHYRYIAIVLTGLQVLIYTVYKVYQLQTMSSELTWRCFVWVTIPFIAITGILFFLRSSYELDKITQMFQQQMSEMVLVNSLTGLYNAKAMYIDLERQMAFSIRKNEKVCLAIAELRYASELKSILNKTQFQNVIQRFARSVEDALRLEDRCYSLDDDGAIGIILWCDGQGASVVKRRIKENASDPNNFVGIIDRALKVDVRMAYIEYDSEVIKNAIEFKQKTENELQYDV